MPPPWRRPCSLTPRPPQRGERGGDYVAAPTRRQELASKCVHAYVCVYAHVSGDLPQRPRRPGGFIAAHSVDRDSAMAAALAPRFLAPALLACELKKRAAPRMACIAQICRPRPQRHAGPPGSLRSPDAPRPLHCEGLQRALVDFRSFGLGSASHQARSGAVRAPPCGPISLDVTPQLRCCPRRSASDSWADRDSLLCRPLPPIVLTARAAAPGGSRSAGRLTASKKRAVLSYRPCVRTAPLAAGARRSA